MGSSPHVIRVSVVEGLDSRPRQLRVFAQHSRRPGRNEHSGPVHLPLGPLRVALEPCCNGLLHLLPCKACSKLLPRSDVRALRPLLLLPLSAEALRG